MHQPPTEPEIFTPGLPPIFNAGVFNSEQTLCDPPNGLPSNVMHDLPSIGLIRRLPWFAPHSVRRRPADSIWIDTAKMLCVVWLLSAGELQAEDEHRLRVADAASADVVDIERPACGTACGSSHCGDRPDEDRVWIISSRRACQKLHADCRCELDYFAVDKTGALTSVGSQGFRAGLRPDVPVCILTHGSFVGWKGMLQDVRPTIRWLRSASSEPLQFVFFTWPSNHVTTMLLPVDVGLLGRRSARNGFYLANLIADMPSQTRVCLMGHSHGARVSVAALHLLAGGSVQRHCLDRPLPIRRRIRTVLAAAAVDHHHLNPGERYGRALSATECLVNLVNRRDMALVWFPLRKPFGRRALSQSGWLIGDRSQLGDLFDSVFQLDVTPILKFSHAWPAYVDRDEIAGRLAPIVFFTD